MQQIVQSGYACIVVDDGSNPSICLPSNLSTCHLVRHPDNLGQGAALSTGMKLAQQLKANYIVHFDADGQHQVRDIPKMLAPLISGKADISLGSRFLAAENARMVPLNKSILLFGGRVINYLFTRIWLTDAHNGLRALNEKALHVINLQENRMAHATEILWEIKRQKLRFCEVPVRVIYSDGQEENFSEALKKSFQILYRLLIRTFFR